MTGELAINPGTVSCRIFPFFQKLIPQTSRNPTRSYTLDPMPAQWIRQEKP